MKRNAAVDSIRWFEIEPKSFLHTMNAWEDGERIHCDVTELPNPPDLFPNADGSPAAPEGDGYIISVVSRAATSTSELLILNAKTLQANLPLR